MRVWKLLCYMYKILSAYWSVISLWNFQLIWSLEPGLLWTRIGGREAPEPFMSKHGTLRVCSLSTSMQPRKVHGPWYLFSLSLSLSPDSLYVCCNYLKLKDFGEVLLCSIPIRSHIRCLMSGQLCSHNDAKSKTSRSSPFSTLHLSPPIGAHTYSVTSL
jgi:hypothetical protein